MTQPQQLTNKEIITNFLEGLSDEVIAEIKDIDKVIEGLSCWRILKAGNDQMILGNDTHESTLQITVEGQLSINVKEKEPKQARLLKNASKN